MQILPIASNTDTLSIPIDRKGCIRVGGNLFLLILNFKEEEWEWAWICICTVTKKLKRGSTRIVRIGLSGGRRMPSTGGL